MGLYDILDRLMSAVGYYTQVQIKEQNFVELSQTLSSKAIEVEVPILGLSDMIVCQPSAMALAFGYATALAIGYATALVVGYATALAVGYWITLPIISPHGPRSYWDWWGCWLQ